MKVLRFLAKSAVTAYGSYTKGQIIEVEDTFALHLIQNGLAEEVNAAQQPARFNKAYDPSDNPEKKARQADVESPTGALRPSGPGITSQSLPAGQALQSPTSKRFQEKK